MEKVKNLYEELKEKKDALIELFDVEKEDLIYTINCVNYEKISNLHNYNTFTKIMTTVKTIEEIDIKLKTLRYILKD